MVAGRREQRVAGVDYELARVNVSRLLAPIDSPHLAKIMEALDEVNAAGDISPPPASCGDCRPKTATPPRSGRLVGTSTTATG